MAVPVTFLSFSFLLAIFYWLMALTAFFQIARIIFYRHRLLSFQIAFLLLCLMWGLIRGTFFTFILAWVHPMVALVLFWFPYWIQFSTFALLVIFYMKQVYRATWEEKTWRTCTIVYFISNFAFFIYLSMPAPSAAGWTNASPEWLIGLGQGFSGLIFLVLVIVLGYYGFRVFSLVREGKIAVPFQVKGASNKLVIISTMIIVLLFVSRSLYDFITIFGLLSLPVQSGTSMSEFIVFILYFVWEITPAFTLLFLFFRIPSRRQKAQIPQQKSGKLPTQYVYSPPTPEAINGLFNDENRYDSDEHSNFSAGGSTPPLYGHHTPYSTSRSDTESPVY